MAWVARNTGLLPAINNWWEIGSVDPADIVAVYQPVGADTQAKSYTNLINPGTNDANPVVAPTWNTTTGWTFTGTQHLTTGIVGNGLHTFIIRINNISTTAVEKVLMGYASGRSQWIATRNIIAPILDLTGRYNTPFISGTPAGSGDAIACIARNKLYLNGNLYGSIADSSLATWSEGEVFIANDLGLARYIGDISAIAIYNRELTQSEIAEIGGNMSALTSADDPDPVLPSVNYIVQNPATRRLNSNSHELWVAASSGIFRTFNGGRGWAKITLPNPSNSEFSDSPAATVSELTFHWIDYDPTDQTILYVMAAKASVNRVWIYKTINLGESWTSRGITTA